MNAHEFNTQCGKRARIQHSVNENASLSVESIAGLQAKRDVLLYLSQPTQCRRLRPLGDREVAL